MKTKDQKHKIIFSNIVSLRPARKIIVIIKTTTIAITTSTITLQPSSQEGTFGYLCCELVIIDFTQNNSLVLNE